MKKNKKILILIVIFTFLFIISIKSISAAYTYYSLFYGENPVTNMGWPTYEQLSVGVKMINDNDLFRQYSSRTICLHESNYYGGHFSNTGDANYDTNNGGDRSFYVSDRVYLENVDNNEGTKMGTTATVTKVYSNATQLATKDDIYSYMAYVCYYASNDDPRRTVPSMDGDTLKNYLHNNGMALSYNLFNYLGNTFFDNAGIDITLGWSADITTNPVYIAAQNYKSGVSANTPKISITSATFDGTNIVVTLDGGRGGNDKTFNFSVTNTENNAAIGFTLCDNNGNTISSVTGEGTYKLKLNSNTATEAKVTIRNEYDVYDGLIYLGTSGYVQDLALLNGIKTRRIVHTASKNVDLGCNVSVKKETIKVGSTTAVASTDAEKTYEIGDEVIFKITVTNNSGRTINMNITDTFDTNAYEYVSVSEWSWSYNSSGKYTRNVDVSTAGGTYYIKLRLKDNLTYNSDNKYINTVEISNFKRDSEDTKILNNKSGNTEVSTAYAKCKKYKATINKYITDITDQTISDRSSIKGSGLSADSGDYVIFCIEIKNTGNSSTTYGNIYNIEINDTWTNSDYVSDIKYAKLNSTKTAIGDFYEEDSFNYWTSVWDVSGNTIKYINSDGLAPGDFDKIYIKCKVHSDKENKLVTNTATITNIYNKNNLSIVNKMETITDSSSDEFLTKRYELEVKKEVLSIKGKNNVTISNKNQVEIGDTVTYRITVTNSVPRSYYGGKIYKFNLKDYFEAENFASISIEGTNWSTEGFDVVDGIQTFYLKYENSAGLAPGESTFVDVIVSINKIKEQISNTAEIILSEDVINKNDEDISDILTGNLSDTETIGVLAYKVRLKKYVLSANSKREYGRVDSSNEWKNNNPVLVQNGDTITYTIVLKNIGETNIKGITISDIIDSGLEFTSGDSYTNITITKTLTTGVRQSLTAYASTLGNSKTISLPTATFLDAGETLRINVTVKVTASDFHLLNLKNIAEVASLRNRNDVAIKDLVEYDGEYNEDYVRLNDPIIEGTVWLDEDEDGFMDRGAVTEEKLEGITVKLYDATYLKVATTTTNSEGKYKFSATNGISLMTGEESSEAMVLSDGRVVKATNRDQTTGNYNSSSSYINYYIEFEYDGTKYRSTLYSNDTYLEDTRNLPDRYEADSNATEFKDVREQFNEKLEIISNNKGQSESGDLEVDLSYEKNGHESKLEYVSGKTTMTAQTFINPESSGLDGISNDEIKYLWIEKSNGDRFRTNEYLKYINLGLVSNEVDIKLKQDLYKVQTTINGEEMIYVYNQGHLEDSEYAGEYVTGGETNPKDYEFKLYNSDYYYDPEKYYNSEVVKQYKQNTELDVEVTYKLTITNENVGKEDDGTYAIIREIVNYYDEDFVKYGDFSNNIKQIKILDREGYLQERERPTIYAEDVINPVLISDTPKYGEKQTVNGYNNLYITGLENKKLEKGESYNLLVTFTVATSTEEIDGFMNRLLLGEKASISEINAYSIYNADGTPSGHVDRDSNPGNMVNEGAISEYEDDTYKTVVNITKNAEENNTYIGERKETGIVWNDTRSEEENGQYAGNGENTIDSQRDTKHSNAKTNPKIDETHDIPIEGAKVEMIEQVAIKQGDGSVRIYEEIVKPWKDGMMKTRTDAEGKYTISGFIPGKYITRFSYGDTESEEMLLYNGQDYKSTRYVESFRVSENNDDVIASLEESGYSDARDDEIQRLEVNSYAEVVNTQKMEILNQTAGNNAELVSNAEMHAETITYRVKPEKILSAGKSLGYVSFYENMMNGNRYSLNNIDFGIEYRPEVNMNLDKYILNIKVTLSNGTELFNLKYDKVYEDDNVSKSIIGTTLSESSSIGADKFQFIPRTTNNKGLGILNTDIDLLQGATVDVEYIFVVNNESEIDRISERLYKLRYKENPESSSYANYFNTEYTATGTAFNQLYDEYYDTDENGTEYKTKEKKETEYYGKYLGEMYYKGVPGTTDKVAEIKVDKILDYVDTDLTFNTIANSEENNLWKATNSQELYDGGYITQKKLGGEEEDGIKYTADGSGGFLVNTKGVQYNTDTQSNLAISVDDRSADNDTEVINAELSKFLKPKVVSEEESSGWITIKGNTLIASDEQTADMTYDNTGEIVQYTTQTGRVTRLSSALRATTESILVVPPTGAHTIMYYIQRNMVKIIIAILIVVLIIVGINLKKNIGKLKKTYK